VVDELNHLIKINRLIEHRQRGIAHERRDVMWLPGSNSARCKVIGLTDLFAQLEIGFMVRPKRPGKDS
jgi:hypothetical protein